MSKLGIWRLVLSLMLICGNAFAQVPTITQYGTSINGPWFDSLEAACSSKGGKSTVINGRCMRNSSEFDTVEHQIFTQYGQCPANASKSGSSCYCNSGYQETNGQCVKQEKACKYGSTSSSGYYDSGKNTAGGPAIMACVGGCETVFDGSFPEGSALVNGEKHYYAKGEYIETGRGCAGSAESIGQGIPVTEIPPDTCGEGQVRGNVNGKTVCSKGAGPDSGAATKPDDKKDQTSTTTTKTKDKDSEGNDRETTTVVKKNADGSTTTETTVTVTKSNGNGGTTSTTTTNTVTTGGVGGSGGKGETGGKEDGKDDGKDEEKGKCEKNSSDEGCGGSPANVDGKTFYNAKEKTFSDVLGKASTDLKSSGIGGAFTGFFNVSAGGACPVSQWHIPYINANVSFDVMCQPFALNAMLIIKGVLLVIASFMAFRVAFE